METEGASKRLQWSKGVAAQKEDGRGWWGVSVSKVDDSWWGQNATVHRSKPGIAASQPPFRPTYFPAKGPRTSSESFALHRPPAKVIVGSSLGNFGCLDELVNSKEDCDELFSLTHNFWLS